jgi:hypothetical protein
MSLDKAMQVLQEDIKMYLVEEYVKPQLQVDELIIEFDKQLNSEKCQRLIWQGLVGVTGKIIENKSALLQMYEKYENINFKYYYDKHFIEKKNVMEHPSFDGKPLESFCASLTMHMWH